MHFKNGKGIEVSGKSSEKMRRSIIGAIVTVALITTATASYLVAKRSSSNSSNSPYSVQVEVKRDACKLFNIHDAKKLLGEKTVASSTNANAVTKTVSTSLCSYSSGDSDEARLKVVTILVRSTNPVQAKQAYELSRANNAQTVASLGQGAYYNPDVSQLNILSGELLIRIASTVGNNGKGTLAIPKEVGAVITSRL